MNVNILDFLRPVQLPLAIVALFFLVCVVVQGLLLGVCGFIEKRCEVITFKPKTITDTSSTDGNTSILFKYPAAITGISLYLQMNESFYDAILAAFLRSLQQAGYKLSDRHVAVAPLLSGSTIDALAWEVERARQEFLTVLGTGIENNIRYEMQSGRAPKFLIQLIDSCERLGWKVVPVVEESEGECKNTFSASL